MSPSRRIRVERAVDGVPWAHRRGGRWGGRRTGPRVVSGGDGGTVRFVDAVRHQRTRAVGVAPGVVLLLGWALCSRSTTGHSSWVGGNPRPASTRCSAAVRFGYPRGCGRPGTAAVTATTARGPRPRAGPRNLYVREDKLLIELAQRLMVDGDACASRALEVVAHLRSDVDQP